MVVVSQDADKPYVQCDIIATIRCGGFWFCCDHYNLFHDGNKCGHLALGGNNVDFTT
jgi:hypothetical protein